MVCGSAGIGKSSFAELFIKKFNFKEAKTSQSQFGQNQIKQTVIKAETTDFETKKIQSKDRLFELAFIDTPGYGNKFDIQ